VFLFGFLFLTPFFFFLRLRRVFGFLRLTIPSSFDSGFFFLFSRIFFFASDPEVVFIFFLVFYSVSFGLSFSPAVIHLEGRTFGLSSQRSVCDPLRCLFFTPSVLFVAGLRFLSF